MNAAANGEYKLSINDFVVKAAALACIAVPECNSSWQDTFIRQYVARTRSKFLCLLAAYSFHSCV